jgi:hypothetical protein
MAGGVVRTIRTSGGWRRRLAIGAALSVGLGACFSSSHPPPRTLPTVTTVARPSTTTATTVPGVQTSGPRTVLSPTGLHVRAAPAKTAKILGTAAEGVALDVLGHTSQAGGWFKVKGATVTGWISASPTLSAPGTLHSYTSSTHQFSVLYPPSWTVADTAPHVVFRAPAGVETIVVANAATVSQLARGGAGYREVRSEQVVACGITSDLDTYQRATAPPVTTAAPTGPVAELYLAQIRLTLDPKHALAIDQNLSALSQLQTLRDFANSITFTSPLCQG